ncbi:hypothetical protein RH63_18975 [Salmonella enterica]|nr:hypothetical protein [Salmonella enterica]EBP8095947.1 hypothetical protein [Salmonella enterica]
MDILKYGRRKEVALITRIYHIRHLLMIASVVMPASLQAAESGSTEFTLTIETPGCSVTTPGPHSLGTMVAGTKSTRTPYTMKVTCEANRPYVLYAKAIDAPSSGTDWVAMHVDGRAPGAGMETTLKLLENGTPIDLQGTGENDDSATFCRGAAARDCTLVPEVNVPASAEKGYVSTTVRFTLRHT